MYTTFKEHYSRYNGVLILIGALVFANAFVLSNLTTKPAYWYDEGINVELARNLADFGKLDLIVAPNTLSGAGATVGSTGYPITVPLAGFFKVFGFGLLQARVYMLLWMNVFLLFFFFIAKKLFGPQVAYWGAFLIITFAPFYGNGRSVMGEIPGFVFFLLSFYFLEKKKYGWSGLLLGLSVVSKPSVFIFFIPAYSLVLLLKQDAWRKRLLNLLKVGCASVLALVPWVLIYLGELARGEIGGKIFSHFKNPYQEAGFSVSTNIINNLQTFFQSTTILYFTVLFVLIVAAVYLNPEVFRAHRNFFILSSAYIPLAFFQYLKSFGYLRYLIAAEFLVFMLFVISLPGLVRFVLNFFFHLREGEVPERPNLCLYGHDKTAFYTIGILVVMIFTQVVHLFWFSDIYVGEKAQKTVFYLSSAYPTDTIGIVNLPQVGSLVAPGRKYQYLSTYGLWRFGTNPLLLPPEQMPKVIVADSDDPAFAIFYERDTVFLDGFSVYKKK